MHPLCIYHANCLDGFTAAWAVHRGLSGEVDLFPGEYQKPAPDCADRDVIFVDFCYKREVMDSIARAASTVAIHDHHASAERDLAGWCPNNVSKKFSMHESGATLAWKAFNGGPAPEFVKYVRDRDLWKFALPNSREVNAALFSHKYSLPAWDRLAATPIDELVREGTAIQRKHMGDVEELVALLAHRATIAGVDVPVANLPYTYSSDAGHIMARGEHFAACYYDEGSRRNYSLRSAPDGIDVSRIAALFGGGGHEHAAGFSVPHGARVDLVPGDVPAPPRSRG